MFLDLINFSKIRRALVYVLYLIVVLALQGLVFSRITLLGVRALFVPAAAVAVGMLEGGVWGGVFGLVLGFFCDMGFPENTVLFTVLFPVMGFFSGFFVEFFINRRFFSYMCMSLAALLITALCQMLSLWLTCGEGVWSMLITAFLQTLWSLPVAALLYPPAKWIANRKWG